MLAWLLGILSFLYVSIGFGFVLYLSEREIEFVLILIVLWPMILVGATVALILNTMTKQEALRECAAMWDWLAENPREEKEEDE